MKVRFFTAWFLSVVAALCLSLGVAEAAKPGKPTGANKNGGPIVAKPAGKFAQPRARKAAGPAEINNKFAGPANAPSVRAVAAASSTPAGKNAALSTSGTAPSYVNTAGAPLNASSVVKINELFGGEVTLSSGSVCDDETFLRRASLDLVGDLPSPEEITRFVLDPSPNKRAAAVDRYLADKQYGQNWARYWRDVILYRRSDERALISSNALVVYLTEQLNAGAKWNDVARAFITATGDVRDNGQTALIMAQMAMPEDVTAEVSRIFLGIQIQCAQCHDHKSDRWKRTQFHELAAFFPRVAIRPNLGADKRSFAVVSLNRPFGRRAPGVMEPVKVEHYMPDLDNPSAEGRLMTPVFFATGQKLALGTPDAERRGQLADWITSGSNRWFAKALVNRVWTELVGQGFYPQVDDLGPDRKPAAAKTLELLTTQLIAHDYDIKWLFRTVMATDAYARHSQGEASPSSFAAGCPQKLRADQIFSALTTALGVTEDGSARGGGKNYARIGNNPRAKMNLTFGFDPSTPRDEVAGSIPQALFMMNAPELNRFIRANGDTALAQLIADQADDQQVTIDLYLRCLAREPKEAELKACLDHVKQSTNRAVAFEDILWALINSTAFIHRS